MGKKRRRLGVIINEKAGTARGLDQKSFYESLRLAAKDSRMDIDLVTTDGKALRDDIARLRKKEPIDALIVGGGDGTVSAAARQAMELDFILGVLPLGTMNYFARTLKLPLDPLEAFKSLLTGRTASIDTGLVNGELFLHHVSLGLQPDMIRERKTIVYRSRLGKMMASAQAFFRSVQRARRLMLDAKIGDERVIFATSALIVSNNVLSGSLPPIAERLDDGLLGVYSINSHHWLDLLRLSKDAAMGRWKNNRAIDIHTAQSLVIKRASRPRRDLTVSVDGELHEYTGEIGIEIKPKSLKVLVPN